MRFGEHWEGHPPDDPPQGERWCSHCSSWDDDCSCIRCENCGEVTVYSDDLCEDCWKAKNPNVEKFDREEGLDQESAASWRARWLVEQADKNKRIPHPYWCWCDDCKERD